MAGNVRTAGESVIERTVRLLDAFDDTHRRLSLSTLARRASLPVSTTHRLVAELVAQGALVRTEPGEYVIGRKIWSLGLLAPMQTGIRQVASPFLHDLYAATLATVHLGVREGASVLYVDRLSGNRSVPVVSRVGSRLPLHSTGVGKVLLAHAPDDVLAEAMTSLSRWTPFTITEPERLLRQLERVRLDGYATTVEEMTLGACSVAVPVTVEQETDRPLVVGALGVVVARLDRNHTGLVTALKVAAHGIGRSLDGTEPADGPRVGRTAWQVD